MWFLTKKLRELTNWIDRKNVKSLVKDKEYLDRVVGPALAKAFLGNKSITVHSKFVKLPIEEDPVEFAENITLSFTAEKDGRQFSKTNDDGSEWSYNNPQILKPTLRRDKILKSWREWINGVFNKK